MRELVIPEEFNGLFTNDEISNLKTTFSKFDVDNNGAISEDELKQVFATTGVTLTPSQFRNLFDEIDIDKSGSVSFDEYVKMFAAEKTDKRQSLAKSVFTKAVEVLTVRGSGGASHTFSIEERNAFCKHINTCLADDKDVTSLLPLRPESSDLFEKTSDGIIFCKLINLAVSDTVDERTINKKQNMNKYLKTENLNLALNAAKAIGCQVVNVGSFDLIDGNPILILGLLWQIIKIQLTSQISLKEHPELVLLLDDGEDMAAFLKLPPEAILLRWVNWHMQQAGSLIRISNFGKDVADSEAYSILLNRLNPSKCDLITSTNPLDKATKVLKNAEYINVTPFLTAMDICAGNRKLNLGFVAQLFNENPGLEITEEQLAELDLSMLEIDDQGDSREERVFRMWINSLNITDLYLADLFAGLDGLNILKLEAFVEPGCVDFKKVSGLNNETLSRFKLIENANMAVSVAKNVDLSVVNIGGLDLVDGSKKLILALVWQLMYRYTVQTLQDLALSNGITGKIEESQVVAWANKTVAMSKKNISPINNFRDQNLKNSVYLINLIAGINSQVVQWELVQYEASDENFISNAKYAISLARKIGACVFVVPEDIIEVKSKMIFTFVTALWSSQLTDAIQSVVKKDSTTENDDEDEEEEEDAFDANIEPKVKGRSINARNEALDAAIATGKIRPQRRQSSYTPDSLQTVPGGSTPSAMALRGSRTNQTPSAMAFTGIWKPPSITSPSQAGKSPSPIKPQRRASAMPTLNSSEYKASPWKEEKSRERLNSLSGKTDVKADASYGTSANSNTDFIKKARSNLRKTFISTVPLLPDQGEAASGGKDVHPSSSYSGDGGEVEESEWDK